MFGNGWVVVESSHFVRSDQEYSVGYLRRRSITQALELGDLDAVHPCDRHCDSNDPTHFDALTERQAVRMEQAEPPVAQYPAAKNGDKGDSHMSTERVWPHTDMEGEDELYCSTELDV